MSTNSPRFTEALEQRRMFSDSFTSLTSRGTLIVVGTKKDDTIVVQLHGTKVQAVLNGVAMDFNKGSVKRFSIEANRGNDTVTNDTNRPSTMVGAAGADTLVGGAGGDSLEGDTDDDTIRPGVGNNVLNFGGDELDTLDYSSLDGVSVHLTNGMIDRSSGQSTGTDTVFQRQLQVMLTAGDDSFTTDDETRWDIYGGTGNDQFNADSGGSVDLIDAGAGNDQITIGRDIDSKGGADLALGGAGNDTVTVDAMEGSAEEGTALQAAGGTGLDDYIIPNNVLPTKDVTIPPGFETASISSQGDDLFVHGNTLDNQIEALGAHVTVNGGAGNDTIHAAAQFDSILDGGSGNDVLTGIADVSDPDTTFTPHFSYQGGDGNDTIHSANGLVDTLDGGDGTDTAVRDQSNGVTDVVSNIEG